MDLLMLARHFYRGRLTSLFPLIDRAESARPAQAVKMYPEEIPRIYTNFLVSSGRLALRGVFLPQRA